MFIDVIPRDLTIDADEKLIEQVLINIIKNAIEAIKDINNPEIKIIASQNYSEVIIQIKDNGKGIPNDILDHIFTPFFTTRKTGSGIGLSFSRQVMLKHKGSINVNSLAEEGTTFTLTL